MLLAKPAMQLAGVLPYLRGIERKFGVLGLHGKVLVMEECRGAFCEKVQEAAPVWDKASSSQLQDRPAARQN